MAGRDTRARAARAAGPAAPVSPWKPGSARARERELKREAVIAAAARAFREQGFHNASLEHIAAGLGVTKPTIYHYVGNKEQILFECFRTGVDRIRAAFAAVHDSRTDARTRLVAVVRSYIEAITSEFGWCMVRAEDQDLSAGLSRRIRTLKSEIDQGLRQLIREGQRDGSIRDCDPKMVSFALAGALNWIAHWHRESHGLTPAEIADRFIDIFERGLQPR